MEVYVVGGAVRDTLLGKKPKDRDFVVVGSNSKEMKSLGFKRVGGSFPVFLHPDTGEEYALARTERKYGRGHGGFKVQYDPSVTLEDDLARRDLTINAMAFPYDEHHPLRYASQSYRIDPYGGQEDLENGILRHVSSAFQDDPLRVLRVARFAARYNFAVAAETMNLMKQMAKSGELNDLTPERVWQELVGAMEEEYPYEFFKVLTQVGALQKVLPMVVLGDTYNVNYVHGLDSRLMVVFGGADLNSVKKHTKVTKSQLKLIEAYQNIRSTVLSGSMTPQSVIKLFNKLSIWKDPDVLTKVTVTLVQVYPQLSNRLWFLIKAFDRARDVTYNTLPDYVRKEELKGPQIGLAIDQERERAVRSM